MDIGNRWNCMGWFFKSQRHCINLGQRKMEGHRQLQSMTRYEKWSSCPMLSLLFLNLGQVAKPALNTKGTQAETTVFKGKTKTTERVNVSLPGPMPRKTWTLYVMRTTKHRTRNRTIVSVLRLVGLKYILKSWTDLQISGFKNPIDFPVDSQVSFAATFAACVLAFAREPAFFSTFPELLQRLVSPGFSLSRQLTFVATFVTLSPPLRGLRSDFHERSRVNNERVFWSCSMQLLEASFQFNLLRIKSE